MESKTQHTAGPWRTVTLVKLTQIRKPVAITVCDEYSNQIAKIAHEPKHGTSDCAEANARLIAAAPTMYEGIGDFLAAYDRARIGDWDHGKLIDWLGEQVARLRPIHTKAEGR